LLNVETAYWNLYGSYWNLYSREQGLRFSHEAYDRAKIDHDAGRVKAADYYQARGQYELFRTQRLQAVQTVAENEQQLRKLMGLPARDGQRLVPSDAAILVLVKPDWGQSLRMALAGRPELRLARADVLVGQVKVALARALARDDWPLLNRVLRVGPREARAAERQAALSLDRSAEVLRDMEAKAERFLALEYRRLPAYHEQITAQRAQREAFGEQLRARQQEYLAGRGTLDVLLEAQRFWADALANEYQATVSYNNTRAAFEYARGNLLRHDRVAIATAVPKGPAVRAVERERRRTLEQVRGTPALAPDARVNPLWEAAKAGPAPLTAPALPALLKRVPLLDDAAVPSKR
jgi:outer membrane protein TolC